MATISLACIITGIAVTSAYECEALLEPLLGRFWFGLSHRMLFWREKIWIPGSKFGHSVGGPSNKAISDELVSAGTIAAKEMCKQETKFFVSKVHLPDICRNVYVIPHVMPANELVDKIVKMDTSLMRYRYCPNAMKLLTPKTGPVETIDRDLILQKGDKGKLSFVMRVFDDHESKNRYVAIIYEGDRDQKIEEFVGPMNNL